MKTQSKAKKALFIGILVAVILCVLLFIRAWLLDIKVMELSKLKNWERSISYDMFSDELKSVISEEEFNDRSDKGKYNMYRKLEGLTFEDKENLDGSTSWYKTPPMDDVEIDGRHYMIDYRIDFKSNILKNKNEVVNFTTAIYECPGEYCIY